MLKVLVCGGRDFNDQPLMEETLDKLYGWRSEFRDIGPQDFLVIHGGARGADTLAGVLSAERGWHVCEVKALWRYYDKKAGVLRNLAMLELRPDIVLAFPGGEGTAHMVREAKAAGLLVVEIKKE